MSQSILLRMYMHAAAGISSVAYRFLIEYFDETQLEIERLKIRMDEIKKKDSSGEIIPSWVQQVGNELVCRGHEESNEGDR